MQQLLLPAAGAVALLQSFAFSLACCYCCCSTTRSYNPHQHTTTDVIWFDVIELYCWSCYCWSAIAVDGVVANANTVVAVVVAIVTITGNGVDNDD